MSFHPTLNQALEATDPDLVAIWPLGLNIGYNQTARTVQNGVFVSVYRDGRGFYENAITYQSKCENFQHVI